MFHNAEESNIPVWASENDPRVTRVGRILRNTYIDEFPQFWNVLRGHMSIVGPRPERPEIANRIVEKYPQFSARLSAKPGITGLAQTEYKYANSMTDSRNKLTYDSRYLQSASFVVDGWIIMRTFRRMLLRKGT